MPAHSNHGGGALVLEAGCGLRAGAEEAVGLAGTCGHGAHGSSSPRGEEQVAILRVRRAAAGGVDAHVCCCCGCRRAGRPGGGGSDRDKEEATLEAADEDGAAGELDGDCSGLQGVSSSNPSAALLLVVVVVVVGIIVVVGVGIAIGSHGRGLRAGKCGGEGGRGGRVDDEEGGGDGGVGAEDGDGLGARVGEELAGRGGDEEGWDLRRAVCLEEGGEAFCEEEGRVLRR